MLCYIINRIMSKLSIIYYLSQEVMNLKSSLNSLFSINNLKDHELIFINDDANESVIKIWQDELGKYSDLNYQIVNVSQSLGMSEAYNLGARIANGKFTLFTNQLIIFKPNFLDELSLVIEDLDEDVDLINFLIDEPAFYDQKKQSSNNKDKKLLVYDQFNIDLIAKHSLNSYDKVFKTKMLVDHKIKFNVTHYQPGIFILKVYGKAKKAAVLKTILTKRRKEINLNNNIYDVLFQINQFNQLKTYNEWNDSYDEKLEFCAIIMAFYHFISLVINSNFSDKEKRNAIKIAKELVFRLYPKYEKNKFFQLINNQNWKNYFIKFKPRLSWIQAKFDADK
ncbi:putative glycosyl-transferase [Mycoplasmoides gallisepticum str. R(low)]|uniref:Glycosyl-transferase n=1 Tax=Mycoplasmoides gallisepticum (strain R(low / passage 15 / clone 2)) TaxID=710127 RepID=Q7NB97_MYCGA|nr:glycosyltransferase [Mycoplasmoides gallisepticum]AAP56732.2 putative glycosyl-transferase [Mycoplasmoides gallisepticum str. R(low)]ADC30585.1 putative glycosyl-transferase [Mycoplasmoides gallisepticum str. R(high)]